MANRDKKLKVYGRLDGSNVLIPGSVRWGRTMPKNGHWVELTPVDYCCGSTTTTTTTTDYVCINYVIAVPPRTTSSLTYTDCGGDEVGPTEIVGPNSVVICAQSGAVTLEGIGEIINMGECITTTTTTTTEAPTTSTTTTTTTEEPTTSTTTTTTTVI